jgi:PncC family amidohydrolase
MMVNKELLNRLTDRLIKNKVAMASAESCTGGLIAHTLTNVSGSSSYFDRGVVTYSNTAKMELLGVSETVLQQYGAVSEQVAYAMSKGIRERSKVHIGVATTGIAGPTGGTKEKPVGLVYISVSTKAETKVQKFIFKGSRLSIKEQTCEEALRMIEGVLDKLA